jgi:plastocyanin
MRLVRSCLALLLSVSALSCGGGGGGTGPYDSPGNPPNNPPSNPPSGSQTLGSVTATPTALTLGGGTIGVIVALARDTQGAPILGATVQFTSRNPAVAEVNSQGEVIGLSSGSTGIDLTATWQSVSRTATVDVNVSGSLPTTAVVQASASDYVFTPAKVVISRSGTVSWNFGSLEHNVTFSGGPGTPANIGNAYSTSVNRTFNTAGNFAYACTIHSGMAGTVIVR